MRGDDKFITLRNGGGCGLSRFTGGVPPEGLKKLNAMVDVLNRLDNSLVSLNPQEVIRLVPRPRLQTNCLPVTNNASSTAPQGAFAWINGSAGSDANHLGVIQPLSPGFSRLLVIVDDDIPAGADGLGWPADGCAHPIYDPSSICTLNARIDVTSSQWCPSINPLGPVYITQTAVSGLAAGIFTGERGDYKLALDASGVLHVWKALLWTTPRSVAYTTPGVPKVS